MTRLNLIIGIILVLTLSIAHAENNSPEFLYQKALYLETAKADYEGAIKIYEEIIKQSEKNAEFTVKTLYRMGLCYEKVGNIEKAKECAIKLSIVSSDRYTNSDYERFIETYLNEAISGVNKEYNYDIVRVLCANENIQFIPYPILGKELNKSNFLFHGIDMFVLQNLKQGNIIPANILSLYDILILRNPIEHELYSYIEQYVLNGGCLLLIGYNNKNEEDNFGFKLKSCDDHSFDHNLIFGQQINERHPIGKNVKKVALAHWHPSSGYLSGDENIVSFDGKPVICAKEHGKGKIVISLASHMYYDDYIVTEDNLTLAKNIFQWFKLSVATRPKEMKQIEIPSVFIKKCDFPNTLTKGSVYNLEVSLENNGDISAPIMAVVPTGPIFEKGRASGERLYALRGISEKLVLAPKETRNLILPITANADGNCSLTVKVTYELSKENSVILDSVGIKKVIIKN